MSRIREYIHNKLISVLLEQYNYYNDSADNPDNTDMFLYPEQAVITGNWITKVIRFNSKPISPDKSLKIINHSPDGFNWGYGGSGPAQLALAILLELTDDKEFAKKYYQKFKNDIISKLPKKDFKLYVREIVRWANKNNITISEGIITENNIKSFEPVKFIAWCIPYYGLRGGMAPSKYYLQIGLKNGKQFKVHSMKEFNKMFSTTFRDTIRFKDFDKEISKINQKIDVFEYMDDRE